MSPARSSVKDALAVGDSVFGIIVFTASPVVVEAAAAAGLDFVILDMEHSALDLEHAAHLIRAADAAGIAAFVRVPCVERGAINLLLNLGAAGIVLPHANHQSCAELLKAMRYAPEGERGACQITRAAGYARGNWDRYASAANRNVMAIALIEDAPTLAEFDTLAALPGLDAYFVGPTDLAIALGVPDTSFDDSTLGRALDQVVSATRRHGKYAMTLIGNQLDPEYGKRIAQRGVRMIVLGTDVDLLSSAITRFVPLNVQA